MGQNADSGRVTNMVAAGQVQLPGKRWSGVRGTVVLVKIKTSYVLTCYEAGVDTSVMILPANEPTSAYERFDGIVTRLRVTKQRSPEARARYRRNLWTKKIVQAAHELAYYDLTGELPGWLLEIHLASKANGPQFFYATLEHCRSTLEWRLDHMEDKLAQLDK